jgi:lysophospholipid acyltransferase (LPLAT)-like uncharacterized protein
VASATVPALYVAYMWVVWLTSRVEDCGFGTLPAVRDQYGGFVGMLWHEEVFSVAWAYRSMKPHTLASRGDSGDIISRILSRCGFVVFRGGSSRRASRRRTEVLGEMIHHMKSTNRVVYGITVDGSNGPGHEVKPGALVIARECKKPIMLVRTWARWNIRLRHGIEWQSLFLSTWCGNTHAALITFQRMRTNGPRSKRFACVWKPSSTTWRLSPFGFHAEVNAPL